MLIIEEKVFDQAIQDLRRLQYIVTSVGDNNMEKMGWKLGKEIESIINRINYNAVDLNQSIVKGAKIIRMEM